MTTIPKGPTKATAATIPFTPTVDADQNPTTCHCCGRRAWSIGVGTSNPKEKLSGDPKYLCGECMLIVEDLRRFKRLDVFELAALDHGVEAVGEYLDTIGIFDLTQMDELNRRMIVKAAWQGCAAGLRKELKDAPF